MAKLGLAITESILTEYGKDELLRRLSDPFWFQNLGAVMGMDWHSSGITTSVMGALKRVINPRSKSLGVSMEMNLYAAASSVLRLIILPSRMASSFTHIILSSAIRAHGRWFSRACMLKTKPPGDITGIQPISDPLLRSLIPASAASTRGGS